MIDGRDAVLGRLEEIKAAALKQQAEALAHWLGVDAEAFKSSVREALEDEDDLEDD